MNINTLSQVSKLKADLLEIADVLVTDQIISNEEIAFSLLCYIETLRNIEGDLFKTFRNTKFQQLYMKCVEKDAERE